MKQALASTHTLVNVLRHHQEQPVRLEDDDAQERLVATVNKIFELVSPVAAEVDSIANDSRLTDQGKVTKVLTVGPKVADNFRIVGRELHLTDEVIGRVEQVIFSPLTAKPKDANEVVVYLREDRIRQSIPKGQSGIAFLESVNKGQMETARAILDTPGGHGISDEIFRRGREAFASKTAPEAWQKLEHLNALREVLSALAQQIAQWLIHLGASRESVLKATGVSVPQSFQAIQMEQYLKHTTTAKK